VQYLGAGGFLLKRDQDVLLTAPLFSNPSLLEIALDHSVRPDTELIDRYFPLDGEQARAILVGHSHYDHLLDVPYIALRRAKQADIYGSETMARLLAPIARALQAKTPPTRIVVMDKLAGDGRTPGAWQRIGERMRIMALRSAHSPPLALKLRVALTQELQLPVHLWRGGFVPEDLRELPRSPSEWVQGPVFAYLIDFLDEGGQVAFRVYYRDSGATPQSGYAPESLLREGPVDLAILCPGGRPTPQAHPEQTLLQALRPRAVLVAHWENLFVTQDLARAAGAYHAIPSPNAIELADVREFVRRIERLLEPSRAPVYVPCPNWSAFDFDLH
jgi:L-ascorbate metabolism protein UlaG (beta-lactamase superfamily)